MKFFLLLKVGLTLKSRLLLLFLNKNLSLNKKLIHLGDILLSYGEIKREAIGRNISFIDHMIHLIVHGVLHLCGYDHLHKRDEKIMMNYEKIILAKVGIKDPYIEYN